MITYALTTPPSVVEAALSDEPGLTQPLLR